MAATAVSIAGTGVVTAAALASTALITNKIIDDSALKISKLVHSKGAVNAFNTISTLQVSKSQMRKTIIEAGIDIFLHYSSQYMNVTCRAGDSVGMEILANHAAVRVVDYLRSQEDGIRVKNSKAFLRELRTMITKGIVLGGNQGVFKMLGKYLKKCTEELLKKIARFQPMFSLKDIEEIPSLDNIYTKTCLVKITNGSNAIQYYARKKSDARYGHRAMFEWELGSELHGEWKLQERPPQEWRGYTLKPEEFEKKTNEILKKIEGKDQVLKADVWAIKANTEKLLDNNAEMKQMLCNIQSFVARSKSKEVGGDSDYLLQLIFKQDKVEELKSFIDQESIFKFRDKHGYNLLQLAATYDSLEILKYLRQNHGNYFDYKIKDGYGYNLLQLVIENDSVKVLMHLLKHYDEHFDYKIRDDCGLDLLQLAVGNGSIKVLEHLLEHYGKYFNHNIENKYVDGLLQLAVRHDLMEVLEFLLGYYGRNFDYKVEVNCRLDFLQLAIERDSEKMLRYLLVGKEFGCEIEGNKMLELLWSVIEYDSIEVLKCLVKEHYDYYYYQIKDNTEFDLLGLAIQNDSMKTLKYLVENEIFDYKDKRYALVLSAIQGNLIEVLTYLTKKDNFSYKIKNKGRVSFLLEAAKNGSMEALNI